MSRAVLAVVCTGLVLAGGPGASRPPAPVRAAGRPIAVVAYSAPV